MYGAIIANFASKDDLIQYSSYIILKKKSWCDDNSLNRDCGLGTTLSEILGSFAKKKSF